MRAAGGSIFAGDQCRQALAGVPIRRSRQHLFHGTSQLIGRCLAGNNSSGAQCCHSCGDEVLIRSQARHTDQRYTIGQSRHDASMTRMVDGSERHGAAPPYGGRTGRHGAFAGGVTSSQGTGPVESRRRSGRLATASSTSCSPAGDVCPGMVLRLATTSGRASLAVPGKRPISPQLAAQRPDLHTARSLLDSVLPSNSRSVVTSIRSLCSHCMEAGSSGARPACARSRLPSVTSASRIGRTGA